MFLNVDPEEKKREYKMLGDGLPSYKNKKI
jgi:hypothetical protein